MAKKKLFRRLISVLDARNLIDLEERRPDVVKIIRKLVEEGATAKEVGKEIRDPIEGNPQMWVESKYAESVARALIEEQSS